MGKTLCDWSKKDIEKDFLRLAEIVASPRYACRKCARSAGDSKYLCKPRKLSKGAKSPDATAVP
ncbi:MAG: hypothetical protein EAZ42_08410 [Verrucomicrobia bacterium]|nr:MAG: hypothetical protein EAZ42_08410 [Verrucomicrobiota bacterium]